jgi:hypothetical protein
LFGLLRVFAAVPQLFSHRALVIGWIYVLLAAYCRLLPLIALLAAHASVQRQMRNGKRAA